MMDLRAKLTHHHSVVCFILVRVTVHLEPEELRSTRHETEDYTVRASCTHTLTHFNHTYSQFTVINPPVIRQLFIRTNRALSSI